MPLEIPNLDDRRWADLVGESRAMIPRVAPLWTDHNAHDPGITFIELFAWLAEMQLYQLNRVGQRHRELFGRLAGVNRKPLQPARINIELQGNLEESVFLPAGTQLEVVEGTRLIFETDVALFLTRSRLTRVIVNDGSGAVDQTQANEKSGIAFLAFGENADEGAELRLGFDAFYPDKERELRLNVQVFTDDLAERCSSVAPLKQDDDATNVPRPVEIVWEFSGANGQWLPLALLSDETVALSRSGAITLATPKGAAQQLRCFWIRARITQGFYSIEPRLKSIRLNVLPCSQKETVHSELLGKGTGKPDQWFELAKKPILPGKPPVAIEVANEQWRSVSSFDTSAHESKDYVFDSDRSRVQFGNGVNGQVPLAGQEIRASYKSSQGTSGNVAKGLKWRFVGGGVAGVILTNSQAASGGRNTESLAELEFRARASLDRPQRAVTPNDIELIALSTPSAYVARTKAITNCPVAEAITVVAVPKTRPGRKGRPKPTSPLFLDMVQRNLQRYRLLCDNLQVVGPIYVEVRVSVRLRLVKGAGADESFARVRQALDLFLNGRLQPADQKTGAPRKTSSDSACPTLWPFGRSVFPSEIYAILDGVTGVDFASQLVLSASINGKPVPANQSGAIPIPIIGLVYPGPHDLGEVDVGRRNG
jgi:hypothetical protein